MGAGVDPGAFGTICLAVFSASLGREGAGAVYAAMPQRGGMACEKEGMGFGWECRIAGAGCSGETDTG